MFGYMMNDAIHSLLCNLFARIYIKESVRFYTLDQWFDVLIPRSRNPASHSTSFPDFVTRYRGGVVRDRMGVIISSYFGSIDVLDLNEAEVYATRVGCHELWRIGGFLLQ